MCRGQILASRVFLDLFSWVLRWGCSVNQEFTNSLDSLATKSQPSSCLHLSALEFQAALLCPTFYGVLGRKLRPSACLATLYLPSVPRLRALFLPLVREDCDLRPTWACWASVINGIWAKAPLKSFCSLIWDAIWEQPNMISHRSRDEGWLPSFIFLELKTAFGSQ